MSTYLAHSENSIGRVDFLKRHLVDVAERAREYASAFGLHDEAYVAGLLHDLGKYGDLFQKRLRNEAQGIDHWSAGAHYILQSLPNMVLFAPAIEGHHIGLQNLDYKSLLKRVDIAQLPGDRRASEKSLDLLVERMRKDSLEVPAIAAPSKIKMRHAVLFIRVRMLFSALVDADHSATRDFFEPDRESFPELRLEPDKAERVLEQHIQMLTESFRAVPSVVDVRTQLRMRALEAAEGKPGLFTLTAPTGSGKTLAMLAFALKHARIHGLSRSVFVLPYLSIVEQTVRVVRDVFRPLLGDKVHDYVTEHTSLARYEGSADEEDLNDESARIRREMAVNWEAPIIITTSVQALESLHANRPVRCRKIHRVAKSVLLFDEVQTLDKKIVKTTLSTLSALCSECSSSVVFSTATQPAFGTFHNEVKELAPCGWSPKEINADNKAMFNAVSRTTVRWPKEGEERSVKDIASMVAKEDQVLCILNLKRHASEVFSILLESGEQDIYHISTSMCPLHREEILSRVTNTLAEGKRCRLISTQCVEAGVDIDFPVVFRALGPLDSIAQAAGRCNRNGKLKSGKLEVIKVSDHVRDESRLYPDRAYANAAEVTQLLVKEEKADISDPETFDRYFRELYSICSESSKETALSKATKALDFKKLARNYRLIEQDAVSVLVPYKMDVYAELVEEAEKEGLTAEWVRRARPHSINLFSTAKGDFTTVLEQVRLPNRDPVPDWFILTSVENYSDKTGFQKEISGLFNA